MPPVYRIEYDDEALADLLSLPQKARQQIVKAIEKLGNNPQVGNIKQLKSYEKLFRLRTGDYRIIYLIEHEVILITVVAVGHRKDIYDLLKRRVR